MLPRWQALKSQAVARLRIFHTCLNFPTFNEVNVPFQIDVKKKIHNWQRSCPQTTWFCTLCLKCQWKNVRLLSIYSAINSVVDKHCSDTMHLFNSGLHRAHSANKAGCYLFYHLSDMPSLSFSTNCKKFWVLCAVNNKCSGCLVRGHVLSISSWCLRQVNHPTRTW